MKRNATRAPHGEVRIIGGAWRSRRIAFPASEGLRPTPDRARETVFNWLAAQLPGAACLDLFAGSGAFGFEALSRAAARVVLVEKRLEVVAALRHSREQLGAEQADIVHADAADYLRGPVEAFDIVFIDPPYASGLLGPCAGLLEARGWLKPDAIIYLEAPQGEVPPLPESWRLVRSKTAGQVGYHLARRNQQVAEEPVFQQPV
jgi:16S rRNA (guanine966-N2)-methyltransferase